MNQTTSQILQNYQFTEIQIRLPFPNRNNMAANCHIIIIHAATAAHGRHWMSSSFGVGLDVLCRISAWYGHTQGTCALSNTRCSNFHLSSNSGMPLDQKHTSMCVSTTNAARTILWSLTYTVAHTFPDSIRMHVYQNWNKIVWKVPLISHQQHLECKQHFFHLEQLAGFNRLDSTQHIAYGNLEPGIIHSQKHCSKFDLCDRFTGKLDYSDQISLSNIKKII